jgi:hypothetical protein
MQVVDAMADTITENSTARSVQPAAPCTIHHRGLFLRPDLTSLGAAIVNVPDDCKTHPLDIVPKDQSECCTLPVTRLMAILIGTGMVSTKANPKPVLAEDALQAIIDACFAPHDTTKVHSATSEGACSSPATCMSGICTKNQLKFSIARQGRSLH